MLYVTYHEAVTFYALCVSVAYVRDYQGGSPILKRVKIQGYKSLVDMEVNLQPLTVLLWP
jgi:hypothetical protein